MKKPVVIRRKPKQAEVKVEETKQCPLCPHKASDHNQFGCCFTEEICPCLKTRKELEAVKEESNDYNADS